MTMDFFEWPAEDHILGDYNSQWKEDAETFRKAAVKLGLLNDLDTEEDTDPAEYEEQQFGDWADHIVRRLASKNLMSYLINF